MQWADENGITVFVVVAPATEQYRKTFDIKFKDYFIDVLDSVEQPVHLLDLFDSELFVDEDFLDSDHLNDSGAEKLTKILMKEIS